MLWTLLLLGSCSLWLSGSEAKCSLHFHPRLVCQHFDYSNGCIPGQEFNCKPVKISYNTLSCPVYLCAKTSSPKVSPNGPLSDEVINVQTEITIESNIEIHAKRSSSGSVLSMNFDAPDFSIEHLGSSLNNSNRKRSSVEDEPDSKSEDFGSANTSTVSDPTFTTSPTSAGTGSTSTASTSNASTSTASTSTASTSTTSSTTLLSTTSPETSSTTTIRPPLAISSTTTVAISTPTSISSTTTVSSTSTVSSTTTVNSTTTVSSTTPISSTTPVVSSSSSDSTSSVSHLLEINKNINQSTSTTDLVNLTSWEHVNFEENVTSAKDNVSTSLNSSIENEVSSVTVSSVTVSSVTLSSVTEEVSSIANEVSSIAEEVSSIAEPALALPLSGKQLLSRMGLFGTDYDCHDGRKCTEVTEYAPACTLYFKDIHHPNCEIPCALEFCKEEVHFNLPSCPVYVCTIPTTSSSTTPSSTSSTSSAPGTPRPISPAGYGTSVALNVVFAAMLMSCLLHRIFRRRTDRQPIIRGPRHARAANRTSFANPTYQEEQPLMSGTSLRPNQDFNLTNFGAAAARLASSGNAPEPAGPLPLEEVSFFIDFDEDRRRYGEGSPPETETPQDVTPQDVTPQDETPQDEISVLAQRSGFEPVPASRRVSALARWFNKKKLNTPEDGITDEHL